MGTFSDEEYQSILKVFEQGPLFQKGSEAIRTERAKLDDEISRLLKDKPPDYHLAINVLWQGRNFLARFLNEPEIPLPVEPPQNDDASSKKFVAVYCPEAVLSAAVTQVLTTLPFVRHRVYVKMSELLDSLIKGEICGVIGVSSTKSSVKNLILHDLGHRLGRDQAEPLIPPCADITPPSLVKIWETAFEMMSEKFGPVADEASFSLTAAIPELTAVMITLVRTLKIAVVDDDAKVIAGVIEIFGHWPNLITRNFLIVNTVPVEELLVSDIILLDESMPIKGTAVRALVLKSGFQGIIASTTGGDVPDWADKHFGGKAKVARSLNQAKDFVKFMNGLIRDAH